MMRTVPLLVAAGLLVCGTAARVIGQGGFPARLDTYFTQVLKLSAAERKVLLDGGPLTKHLDSDPNKEVGVFGAVWIAAPRARYVAAIQDIENFETRPGIQGHEEDQRARARRRLCRARAA